MSTTPSPATVFKGYAIKDANEWTNFEVIEFQPKNWEETDVELQITHCGVCGSDVHTLHPDGWKSTTFPAVVGHEICGIATKVGSEVQGIKVGDRVGVGAQISSCLSCKACTSGNENYCPKMIDTYNDKYTDGVLTQGGYSNAIRANQQFVFPIPDGLESKYACSMLCGGLTVYSPLKRNGCGPGKKVGIVGIGGLGHYAVLFAKAMGAEVYAFTHSARKVDDIKELGADHVIIAHGEGWEKPLERQLDIIISTRDASNGFPLKEYLSMLWVNSSFICVGLPDEPLPPIPVWAFLGNGAKFGSSHIGSKEEAVEMLQLAAEKGIKPWIEELPMRDVAKAIVGVKENKARYRYVLTQDLV